MPRNLIQEFIFTLIMASFMVYLMSLYNVALSDTNHNTPIFSIALGKALQEYFIAVPIAFLFVSRLAKILALRFITEEWRQSLMPYGISFFTAFIMVPVMTCILNTVHFGFEAFSSSLLDAILRNYIFALPLQVIFIGPLVRSIFSYLYPVVVNTAQ